MRKLLLLPLLVLVGCSGGPAPEELSGAVAVVWHLYQGQSPPPGAVFVEDWCMENGVAKRAFESSGACVTGRYDKGGLITVEREDTIHASGYAHELMHALQWLDFGISDPGHTADAWKPGHDVDQANAALAAAGY